VIDFVRLMGIQILGVRKSLEIGKYRPLKFRYLFGLGGFCTDAVFTERDYSAKVTCCQWRFEELLPRSGRERGKITQRR
jgi:hypothetical protein